MSVIVVLYCLEAEAMCLSLAFYFLKKSVQGQFLFSMHYTQISPLGPSSMAASFGYARLLFFLQVLKIGARKLSLD